MKFGLRNIRVLLKSVGNPQDRFPSIHVAGTNGKGSTCAFLASILMEAGYRTGLYTSPHLVRFTERIRINGNEITEKRLVEYVRLLKPAIESARATFFEATTCIAFRYFADEDVQIVVIETGLGGRLDATNVVRPLASLITNVSYDHKEQLGNTLRSIAREKAGIIKNGIPCIIGHTEREATAVIRSVAHQKRAPFFQARRIVKVTRAQKSAPLRVQFQGAMFRTRPVSLGLQGSHQLENARLALAALDQLRRLQAGGIHARRITSSTIAEGLERVCPNAGIRGRLETLGRNRIILDVAHNPAAIETLVSVLKKRQSSFIVVFGVMRDKEYRKMLAALSGICKHLVAVSPALKRALSSSELMRVTRQLGISATSCGSVKKGVMLARRVAGKDGTILITGSHYVVGEALEALGEKRLTK
jgi:dihydrofolate synthase/folylpolyglutamate synthase